LAGAPGAGLGGEGTGGTFGSGASFGSGGTFGSGASFGTGAQAGTGGGTGTGGGSQTTCASGAFDTDLTDDVLTCALWSDCPAGTRRVSGSFDHDATCEACTDGTYSTFENATLCLESRCGFGEVVVDPGSPTTPRTCADTEVFPKLPSNWYAGALAATTTSIYLAYWPGYDSGYDGGYRAARYSLDGGSSSTFALAELAQQLPDLAHSGGDLYVAGWTYDTDASAEVVTDLAFASKYDESGALLWTHTFDEDTTEHFSSVQVAASEDAVYLVGIVTMMDCNLEGQTVDCGVGSIGTHLVLRVLDAAGNPTLSTILEENTFVFEIRDIALASDGHLYVLVSRTSEVSSYVDTVVLEFDGAGEPVSEHVLENVLGQLAADESGNVFALSASDFQPHLYRLSAFGDFFDSTALGVELGDSFDVFTATDSGVVAVGVVAEGPLLVSMDSSGEVLARDVLDQLAFSPDGFFLGVQQATDGTIFVTGWDGESRFLNPWP